jgi:hypothetical protein
MSTPLLDNRIEIFRQPICPACRGQMLITQNTAILKYDAEQIKRLQFRGGQEPPRIKIYVLNCDNWCCPEYLTVKFLPANFYEAKSISVAPEGK